MNKLKSIVFSFISMLSILSCSILNVSASIGVHTGDHSNVKAYLLLIALSGAAIILLIIKKVINKK